MKNEYEKWYAKPNEYVSHRYVCVATGYFKGFTTTITMVTLMGNLDKAINHFGIAIKMMGMTNPSTFNVVRED